MHAASFLDNIELFEGPQFVCKWWRGVCLLLWKQKGVDMGLVYFRRFMQLSDYDAGPIPAVLMWRWHTVTQKGTTVVFNGRAYIVRPSSHFCTVYEGVYTQPSYVEHHVAFTGPDLFIARTDTRVTTPSRMRLKITVHNIHDIRVFVSTVDRVMHFIRDPSLVAKAVNDAYELIALTPRKLRALIASCDRATCRDH